MSISRKGCGLIMARKITMNRTAEKTFEDVFSMFITSKTAKGVSDITIRNYHQHLHSISKHIDITIPFDELTKSDLDNMIVSMRKSGLAHNSIATYVRVLKTFFTWCNNEDLSNITLSGIREKETVKETYSDDELEKLLKKPKKDCNFCEYRSWVIVNFLLNSGCRAGTIRAIQNRDVDLEARQVIFRHNKNSKIQVIPLCSVMCSILKEYMNIRQGEAEDYLFCDQYGGALSENALRLSIGRFNNSRGVKKTSIHLYRHTFARKYLVDCGGDAFMLQRLLGHSTLNMTKHYCAIFDADIAKNYDKVSPLAQISKPREKITRH